MTTKKLFENKSLRVICNAINMGLVETDEIDITKLEILSEKKPDIIIRVIEIDLKEYMYGMVRNSELKTKVHQLETNFYDYVVFSVVQDEGLTTKTLLVMGLLELIMIAPKINNGVVQERTEQDNNEKIWSLDSDEWDLVLTN